MYQGGKLDPEGLFATIPSIVTVITGYLCCSWLVKQPFSTKTTLKLLLAGSATMAAGWFWGILYPLNKPLWTGSFVMFSAGCSVLLLALCFESAEVRKWQWPGRPLKIMGRNSIFLFVATGIFSRIIYKTHIGNIQDNPLVSLWIYEHIFLPWANPVNASFAFSLSCLLIWWIILYFMYRLRFFITI
jgi:predicted acyltransferase